ncbi:type II secretion system F family protein [Streptomyces albus subsp. chlorinus]|uniref:type II secretion system F family protein n=1 Tax=Streptomyces albus TaxID=1888 RepID=UPI0031F603E1
MPVSGSAGGIFSLATLAALACGVAVGGGIALLIAALRGLPAKPAGAQRDAGARAAELARFMSRRGSLAVCAGLLVLLLTRWPVAAVATGVLGFLWDRLFGGAAEERAAMKRVEALAAWTESLRDTIAGAVGLEQAIPASARAAAPSLRPHLDALIDRLRARTPLPVALQHLADELDDPSADIVVAALILNSRLRGPGLREVLGALAKSAREEVDMRQRVRAQRASTRRSVQIVVGVSVAFVLGLAVFNRDFVQPYGSPLGQAVLACVCAMFACGFWWLRKLSRIETPERFLVHGGQEAQVPRTVPQAGEAGTAGTNGPTGTNGPNGSVRPAAGREVPGR